MGFINYEIAGFEGWFLIKLLMYQTINEFLFALAGVNVNKRIRATLKNLKWASTQR